MAESRARKNSSIAGVLRQVVLVAEKRAHAPKLQDTLAAVHDRDLVLGHQLLS